MNSEQEIHSKASADPEAFEFEQQKDDELAYVRELVEHGLPPSVSNAYNEAAMLSKIAYDDMLPEQNEAREHIAIAIKLFQSSYIELVDYTIEETNRILALYPGLISRDEHVIVGVAAIWKPSGEAFLDFKTDL